MDSSSVKTAVRLKYNNLCVRVPTEIQRGPAGEDTVIRWHMQTANAQFSLRTRAV